MRRGQNGLWGCAAVCAGAFILLALILPSDFWWFVLGVGLIFAGIWVIRRC